MTSRMTLSSMSLVRIPRYHPSTPLLEPPSWHTSNCDINTTFSGYLPWGKRTSFMTSGMTLSSISPVRITQCPPSTSFLTPLRDTPPIEISTQKFQGTFIRVKKYPSWCQEWPCHPCLWSGALNVLQLPPFLIPPSWHTFHWDINMKFSGYLP